MLISYRSITCWWVFVIIPTRNTVVTVVNDKEFNKGNSPLFYRADFFRSVSGLVGPMFSLVDDRFIIHQLRSHRNSLSFALSPICLSDTVLANSWCVTNQIVLWAERRAMLQSSNYRQKLFFFFLSILDNQVGTLSRVALACLYSTQQEIVSLSGAYIVYILKNIITPRKLSLDSESFLFVSPPTTISNSLWWYSFHKVPVGDSCFSQ